MTTPEIKETSNFIHDIIEEDNAKGTYGGKVITRFPPEPNGYLHIGHAKSIVLNFGTAHKFGGRCNLRFDDTNPVKEEQEYIDSIQKDVRWLGYDWGAHLYFASDYFEDLYQMAVTLIEKGKAFVCELTADQMREYRGTLKEPGKNSPYRDRSVEENLDLFKRMRAGEFGDGEKVLRAKIDMASPNISMRDPVLYRIMHAHHHRTGDDWCIYPTYDFAHGQSDSLEEVTHSICTLEFENHRPLYDWLHQELEIYPSRQIEFARLNLEYTVMSKRKLLRLVQEGHVNGWDDPRMPTISGMRRRGYTPEAIRDFCDRIGVAKADSTVEFAMLEYCLREDLNKKAPRVMAVMDPLKLVITNYPEDQTEQMEGDINPEQPELGKRTLPFSRELYIEGSDFREEAPKKYFRLAPGKEVRLKHAYYVTCTDYIKDDQGNVVEVHATYDPATKGGWSDDGRKVKGTMHWVSIPHAHQAEVRIYTHLFTTPDFSEMTEEQDFLDFLNPESLTVAHCYVEPSVKDAEAGTTVQFERTGYYTVDPDSTDDALVFNSTVGLRDTWAKIEKKMKS